MGSNWKTTRLLDQYEVRSGLSKPAKDFGTGYPFLTFKDVFYNYFTPEVLGDLVESTDKERDGCSVKRGDVFLTRTSETMNELGMSCVALKDYEGATFNGFCKRLRPNEQCELVPEYVGYYLRSPKFRQAMLAFSTMSTRASLNNEMIGRLEISYPPKEAQRHIAHVLKTLDNKITLNRQINQTLEQMAQTLFKSWFVDFDPVMDNALDAGSPIPDELQHRAEVRKAVRESEAFKPLPDDVRQLFPDAFEESELGWLPKGWVVSTAGDEFTVKGGSTPSTKSAEFWEGGDIHWTSPKDLSGKAEKILLDTERKITTLGLRKITSGLLPPETVLMSSRAPVGYLAMTKVPVAINQGYIAITESKSLTQEFALYWLNSKIEMIKSISGGTTFAEISKKTFRTIPIVVPSAQSANAFSETVALYLNKISKNVEECSSLGALRDSLLPKLISGELEII
ncbi:TPA: restriction endonuclease subunit S [Vibrio vulnificus]|uniref:restriction endonuclease subunit S n=2 Tax=Vibrio vulnificus TaxID=672 RepID=UPI0019D46B8C|nr:restriction endonuclease subunit S [Vibrio vulnificus]MBN8089790.1 restriction endonuclease subunit S [Vibrio vulnificus]MBN8118608.1 restriction endonuclease subunit S [Vibrio vulnificus]HDZ3713373.1 restriction endonuclease subunit S [Vibrio vulnificus]